MFLVGPDDVLLKVLYCGICHTDLHQIRNEWGGTTYPIVPGHEIAGVVEQVGKNVTEFKAGDKAAIGCMVNSCRTCKQCKKFNEQYCPKFIATYNGTDVDGTMTYGGYSTAVVCNKDFVLRFPENLAQDAGAPLLCAGITVYSPMKHFGLDKPGMKIAVVGLGGLGHMAVKFGKSFGAHVTVVSRSDKKKDDAMKLLGADDFLVSEDEQQMKEAFGKFDGIIDTVSAKHDLSKYAKILGVDGKYVFVGVPPEPYQIHASELIFKRLSLAGSLIGGIKETQEMLDFCGTHNITCEVEKIKMSDVNEAMERLAKSDVKYRFVIDIEGSLKDPSKN